jgi:hypothetical protein
LELCQEENKKNYNSKREDLEEEDHKRDESLSLPDGRISFMVGAWGIRTTKNELPYVPPHRVPESKAVRRTPVNLSLPLPSSATG